MVRAQQAGDHDRELGRDEREDDGVPALEDDALKVDVRALAPGEDAPRVARLADGRLDKGVEVAAAVELVLDAQAAVEAEVAGPLGVDLALEVECALLVGDVAWGDEEGEADPEEEGVDGEEGAVVEEDAGPADDGGDDGEGCGDGGDNELGLVADADDVGVVPDVEVDEEGGDEASERVD